MNYVLIQLKDRPFVLAIFSGKWVNVMRKNNKRNLVMLKITIHKNFFGNLTWDRITTSFNAVDPS